MQALEAVREGLYTGKKELFEIALHKLSAALEQPEQRKPLTLDEIAEVAERMEATDAASSFWRDFARAIEAAHGIKEKP